MAALMKARKLTDVHTQRIVAVFKKGFSVAAAICRPSIEISQLKTMPQRKTTNISRSSKFPDKSSGSSQQMVVSECESLGPQMGLACFISPMLCLSVGLFQLVNHLNIINNVFPHIIYYYLTYSIQRWPDRQTHE